MFRKGVVSFRLIAVFTIIAFIGTLVITDLVRVKATQASVMGLPEPTALLSMSEAYSLPMLKGMKVDPADPLKFDFIIDTADAGDVAEAEVRRMIGYFLAGLTVPEKDIWVNLSPYEADRIAEDALTQTDLGNDLLAQDYLLKQLSSSLTHPDTATGAAFWKAVIMNDELSMMNKTNPALSSIIHNSSFNKVWIMPDEVTAYERENTVILSAAKLKVMLEKDYVAATEGRNESKADPAMDASADAMRTLILPEITKDVNGGRNFARLRQIYNSLALAMWFKQKLLDAISAGMAGDNRRNVWTQYVNKERMNGIDGTDPATKDKIYALYVEAFKKGVYNVIRRDQLAAPKRSEGGKRQYFSGGARLLDGEAASAVNMKMISSAIPQAVFDRPTTVAHVLLGMNGPEAASSDDVGSSAVLSPLRSALLLLMMSLAALAVIANPQIAPLDSVSLDPKYRITETLLPQDKPQPPKSKTKRRDRCQDWKDSTAMLKETVIALQDSLARYKKLANKPAQIVDREVIKWRGPETWQLVTGIAGALVLGLLAGFAARSAMRKNRLTAYELHCVNGFATFKAGYDLISSNDVKDKANGIIMMYSMMFRLEKQLVIPNDVMKEIGKIEQEGIFNDDAQIATLIMDILKVYDDLRASDDERQDRKQKRLYTIKSLAALQSIVEKKAPKGEFAASALDKTAATFNKGGIDLNSIKVKTAGGSSVIVFAPLPYPVNGLKGLAVNVVTLDKNVALKEYLGLNAQG